MFFNTMLLADNTLCYFILLTLSSLSIFKTIEHKFCMLIWIGSFCQSNNFSVCNGNKSQGDKIKLLFPSIHPTNIHPSISSRITEWLKAKCNLLYILFLFFVKLMSNNDTLHLLFETDAIITYDVFSIIYFQLH